MLPRGGGGSKKSAMGPKIIAILPYIKQVPAYLIVFKNPKQAEVLYQIK